MDKKICNRCGIEITTWEKSLIFSPTNGYRHLVCDTSKLKIAEARYILNMSQREIGAAFGVTDDTIGDWEKGRSSSMQTRICREFLANWIDKRGLDATRMKLIAMQALNSTDREEELRGANGSL